MQKDGNREIEKKTGSFRNERIPTLVPDLVPSRALDLGDVKSRDLSRIDLADPTYP